MTGFRLFFGVVGLWSLALPVAAAPRVVVDIAPLHGLVAQVMAGVGTPHLIVRPGQSPHDYQLRPSDAGALQEADAVIWVGAALTPWFGDHVESLAGGARSLPLLDAPGTVLLDSREVAVFVDEAEEAHDHDDDHGHDHAHDHGHDHGEGVDPHAWLSTENAINWTAEIAWALSDIDPENAETYRANARAAQAELAALGERTRARLGGASARYVVAHDSYQYFERQMGWAAVGAISDSDAVAPGAARLAALRAAMTDRKVDCLIVEAGTNTAAAEALVEATGTRLLVADPLGLGIEPGPGFYAEMMMGLTDSFAACLPQG